MTSADRSARTSRAITGAAWRRESPRPTPRNSQAPRISRRRPSMTWARGRIIDTKLGNIVKANRFGYVKRVFHGTAVVDFDTQRDIYSRVLVDLAEKRWVFLNTLFALSEGCMYAQLVDLLDKRAIDEVM